jgi:hypothetical protein
MLPCWVVGQAVEPALYSREATRARMVRKELRAETAFVGLLGREQTFLGIGEA